MKEPLLDRVNLNRVLDVDFDNHTFNKIESIDDDKLIILKIKGYSGYKDYVFKKADKEDFTILEYEYSELKAVAKYSFRYNTKIAFDCEVARQLSEIISSFYSKIRLDNLINS